MPKNDTPGVTGTPSSGSRLSLRNWKLRSKLALVLAIPMVTAMTLGGLRVEDELNEASLFKETAAQIDFAGKVTDVVQSLQGERTLAIARVINPGDNQVQADLRNQASLVDRAVGQLRSEAVHLEGDNPDRAKQYAQALKSLDALGPLRASVNTPPYPELAAFTTYSSIIDSLVRLGRVVTSSVPDQELLHEGATLQALSEAKEFQVREDAALEIAAMRNAFSDVLLDQIRAAQYSAVAALDQFKANATPDQLQRFTDTVSGPQVDDRARLSATALAHAEGGVAPNINRDQLVADSSANLAKLRAVETGLLDQLHARSDELAGAATAAAWRDIGLVLGALIIALLTSVLVARLMLKPLRVLRRSALHIAHTQLPETVHRILADPDPVAASKNAVEPVPINTREEIGEVARSFDAVHEQAIKMAAEQALLRENVNGIFVNLSRRSQRLVERQLGVIDRLEADEQDPDHLASLFELDHLATRLRRNGESLLVLSGAGLAKSVPKPVSAADVIGAAVSEIEQYARVEVGVIPDVAVRGLTVHDLVHLLAELLDNATYFSEPETKVTVRAVVTRRRALAIQITDRGVGMSEEQIAEANKRLADPPDLDVSVTRRMGLYVVARLAKRHGIEVRLRENEDIEGGVIARIVVPAELLGPVPAEAPPPPPSGAEISWPSTLDSEPETPASRPDVPEPRPRPASPTEVSAAEGIRPLSEPMTLDDLVAGSSKAVYTSQGKRSSSRSSNGNNGNNGKRVASELPKREQAADSTLQPEKPKPTDVSEDDTPTKRLPIYQSVVSRWFTSEAESAFEAELAESAAQAQETAQTTTEATAMPEPEAPATAHRESPSETPQATGENGASTDEGWRSAADEGWRAAQALLESKPEEITAAGLPKRVPNAYLVPGSISGGGSDSFVDRTAGQPGQSAIARSAAAARERMVSFQRGYTSGRRAVSAGKGADSVAVSGGESASPSDRSKE